MYSIYIGHSKCAQKINIYTVKERNTAIRCNKVFKEFLTAQGEVCTKEKKKNESDFILISVVEKKCLQITKMRTITTGGAQITTQVLIKATQRGGIGASPVTRLFLGLLSTVTPRGALRCKGIPNRALVCTFSKSGRNTRQEDKPWYNSVSSAVFYGF